MHPKIPIFLFAFANDKQNALQLEKEERIVRELLQHEHDGRKIEYHSLGATSLDDIYKIFNRFHNRIHIFHYSGHSDHTFLELVDKKARAANLAVTMGMQSHLKLVILNGCANYDQVNELLERGVKAVIATTVAIEDTRAILFSAGFYDALTNGKSLQESFKVAVARLKEDFPEADMALRGMGRKEQNKQNNLPWGLYAKEDADLNWKIQDPHEVPENLDYFTEVDLNSPDINKVFLELAFKGMAKFNKKNKFLWEDYNDPNSTDTSFYDLQEAIYGSFPSILSVQIRDLFTENAKLKGRLRLTELSEVYLVLGKLLSSIALASLWSAMIDEKTFQVRTDFHLREEYKQGLRHYLERPKADTDSYDYLWLMSTISGVFIDNEMDSFVEELESFHDLFSKNAALRNAYHFLEFELKRRVQAKNIATQEVPELCANAENHLGVLLQHSAFLTSYQMVSVNDITVKKMLRAPAAEFVHNKVLLRGVEDTIMDRDPLSKKNFTCNHAIIITKNFNSEEEPLILTPFLIDENAYKLKRKEQPKIHFLAGTTKDKRLFYQHAEVLSDGFELGQEVKNLYRIQDLEEMATLLSQFAEDLGLYR